MQFKPLKSGFTLVELLVVIAITSLLAAMLFPVFGRARENARRSSCQSNLKQIALGMTQYFQDYDEQFPLLKMPAEPWVITLQPYLKSREILRCPGENADNWLPQSGWFNAGVAGRRTSYTLNGYLPRGNSKPEQGGNFPHLAAIGKPSSLIMLSESPSTKYSGGVPSALPFTGNYFHAHEYDPGVSTSHWDATLQRPDDIAHNRHFGGFNAAFLDGHVKFARWGDVWFRDSSVVQTVLYSDGITKGPTPSLKGNFDPRQ